jgi:hypothetical protein
MKNILHYTRQYFIETDKRLLFSVTILAALLVFINYYFGIDTTISKNSSFVIKLICWYVVFLVAFSLPYLFTCLSRSCTYPGKPAFLFLLFFSPLLFAVKMSLAILFNFSTRENPADPGWNNYWEHVIYWPLLLIIITVVLFALWRYFDKDQPFYGLTTKGLSWQPYLLMLLIMVPLVAAASTQADFLAVYPKIRSVTGVEAGDGITWWHKLLFELSYGSDFFSIELFFRGFLILAFIKWAGKDAILPMACFYCTIHFGKPIGECISSYFGGMLLGIVVYHTRSILGGLLVHLGIAWLMELGGYLGNSW